MNRSHRSLSDNFNEEGAREKVVPGIGGTVSVHLDDLYLSLSPEEADTIAYALLTASAAVRAKAAIEEAEKLAKEREADEADDPTGARISL